MLFVYVMGVCACCVVCVCVDGDTCMLCCLCMYRWGCVPAVLSMHVMGVRARCVVCMCACLTTRLVAVCFTPSVCLAVCGSLSVSLSRFVLNVYEPLSLFVGHTLSLFLSLSCTCCYDEIKGIQDLKICSHADSQILSLCCSTHESTCHT